MQSTQYSMLAGSAFEEFLPAAHISYQSVPSMLSFEGKWDQGTRSSCSEYPVFSASLFLRVISVFKLCVGFHVGMHMSVDA